MKYATIGTGWIAQAYIDGARLAGNWELSAVYSRTREAGQAFAEKTGCECVFTDLDSLAQSDAQAVYIASPNAFHYTHSKQMLLAGKHVLCEKPITVTPEEYKELSALAKRRGLIYAEALMFMHNPARLILQNAISKIGEIHSVRFDFSQYSSKAYALLHGDLPNIFNPALATGCLMDLGIYCVYPVLYFWGMPQKITAAATLLENGIDTGGGAFLEYGDKLVNLTYSKLGQDRLGSQIFGVNGTITIGSISQLTDIRLYQLDGSFTQLCGKDTREQLMANEAQGFYRFITEPETYAGHYLLCDTLALQTSTVMQEMRRQAEICFPGYDAQ